MKVRKEVNSDVYSTSCLLMNTVYHTTVRKHEPDNLIQHVIIFAVFLANETEQHTKKNTCTNLEIINTDAKDINSPPKTTGTTTKQTGTN